jgi:hypothetical protein
MACRRITEEKRIIELNGYISSPEVIFTPGEVGGGAFNEVAGVIARHPERQVHVDAEAGGAAAGGGPGDGGVAVRIAVQSR